MANTSGTATVYVFSNDIDVLIKELRELKNEPYGTRIGGWIARLGPQGDGVPIAFEKAD